uniref:Protein kinase domain-containing protein n=1 Tax=Oryza brachyantha TaxID=4533 RepID=J3MJI9_ORYBR
MAIVTIRRRRRTAMAGDGEGESDDESVASVPPLPREGLYIFTKSELKQATNGYDEKLLLGSGGAGKVYLGRLPSGQRVAIKKIYRSKKVAEFYAEVAVLAKLRHRNLTTLVGYCLGGRGGHHALVYEYLAGGNLWRALFQGELPWLRRLQVAADVAQGLAYLHGFREGAVVHRDVKPTNVLLSESGTAKLSDFGVSRIMPEGGTHVSTEVRGTRGPTVRAVFALACRCVRPYKHERPAMGEVLAELKAMLADYAARADGDADRSSATMATSSSAATPDRASLPSTSSSAANTEVVPAAPRHDS